MLNGGCNALIVRWLCGIAENRVFALNIFLVQKKCVVFNIGLLGVFGKLCFHEAMPCVRGQFDVSHVLYETEACGSSYHAADRGLNSAKWKLPDSL